MKMKISNKKLFWISIAFGTFLLLSSLISISVESGENYYIDDSLLGILVDHNVIALSIYILLVALMLATSLDVSTKK